MLHLLSKLLVFDFMFLTGYCGYFEGICTPVFPVNINKTESNGVFCPIMGFMGLEDPKGNKIS